jgi:hypothetical protein
MHAKKAEMVTMLGESSRAVDAALAHLVDVVRHPGQHGWRSSLGAAVVGFPVVGFAALMVDVSEVIVGRSGDAEWRRAFPEDDPGEE